MDLRYAAWLLTLTFGCAGIALIAHRLTGDAAKSGLVYLAALAATLAAGFLLPL